MLESSTIWNTMAFYWALVHVPEAAAVVQKSETGNNEVQNVGFKKKCWKNALYCCLDTEAIKEKQFNKIKKLCDKEMQRKMRLQGFHER